MLFVRSLFYINAYLGTMYSMYMLLTLHFRKKFLKTFKYILSGTIEIFYPVHTINCTAECKEYFFLKENAFLHSIQIIWWMHLNTWECLKINILIRLPKLVWFFLCKVHSHTYRNTQFV